MARRRLLPAALLLLLALALLALARGSRARMVAPVEGKLLAPPVGEGSTLAWLERRRDGDHLLTLARGGPRSLLSRASLSGLAVWGDRIFTSGAKAQGAAELLSVDLRTDAAQSLAVLSAPARLLASDGDWICGLSGTEPALPAAPFVVAGGPSVVIWAMRAREERPTPVVALQGQSPESVELLGIASGSLYWVTRTGQAGGAVTTISRLALPGGSPQVLVRESGLQRAVLLPSRLAWTCDSREASGPGVIRAVRAASLSGEKPHVIADWLTAPVSLLVAGDRLYAQDREALWELGDARGTQRLVYDQSPSAQMLAIVSGAEYLLAPEQPPYLAARGLSWTGRLRLAVGM